VVIVTGVPWTGNGWGHGLSPLHPCDVTWWGYGDGTWCDHGDVHGSDCHMIDWMRRNMWGGIRDGMSRSEQPGNWSIRDGR
jgi:hypothetical protein